HHLGVRKTKKRPRRRRLLRRRVSGAHDACGAGASHPEGARFAGAREVRPHLREEQKRASLNLMMTPHHLESERGKSVPAFPVQLARSGHIWRRTKKRASLIRTLMTPHHLGVR